MIRKYNKVRDEHTNAKHHNEQKRDIIKFLTRKESKTKVTSKEERLKEYDSFKHENEDVVDGNFRKCHVVKDEKSLDENSSDFIRCESDDHLLTQDNNTPGSSVSPEETTCSAQVRLECVESLQKNDDDKHSHERKMSRFRLKDTFTKFDAKVRRAFSWENTTSLEGSGPNSEFFEDNLVVVGTDGEVRETSLENVIETEIDDAEDALASLERRQSSGSSTTSAGGSPPTSNAASSNCTLDNTPIGSTETSPEEETKDIPHSAESDTSEDRRGSGNRATLILFDEHGKPVPPPRRTLNVTEHKPPSRKSSDENVNSGNNLNPPAPSGCSKSLNVSPNELRKQTKPAMGLNISDAKACAEISESRDSNETSSMPHTPSGAHHGAVSASSGMTSPTGLGVFKAFMSNITKKGSTHALHGMLFRGASCCLLLLLLNHHLHYYYYYCITD